MMEATIARVKAKSASCSCPARASRRASKAYPSSRGIQAAANIPFSSRNVPAYGAISSSAPPNAIGRDFRPSPYLGWTDSGTGVEANLYGLLGVKLGWVEGLEVNLGGLVAGFDVRDPALKLPGFGRIGLPSSTANAALAPSS